MRICSRLRQSARGGGMCGRAHCSFERFRSTSIAIRIGNASFRAKSTARSDAQLGTPRALWRLPIGNLILAVFTRT